MKVIKKILYLLSSKERTSAALLLFMILIMALIDMIGVASILPFMAVVSNPDIIETNIYINKVFQTSKIFGIKNNYEFILFLGIILFIILIFSLCFKAFTTYVRLKFVQMRQFSIGKRLVESYLQQPYSWVLSRNSAEIGKTVLSEVGQVVGGSISPLILLISNSMVAIAIIVLLMLVNFKITMIVGIAIGGVYGGIFIIIKKYLNKIGEARLKNNGYRFIILSEAFGAFKDIKVNGLEQTYINRFKIPAKDFANNTAMSQIVSQLPRFFLEAVAFGGIMLIVINQIFQTGNFSESIPILSLYVFAGYRLLPAIQRIYGTFSSLTFYNPALDKLYNDFTELKKLNTNQNPGIINLNKSITFKNISFNYPNTTSETLKDISLTIPAKTSVGLVGTTGSGKTTIVDIILGLFEVQKGTLEVDDQIITEHNKRAWQRSIGYVPQNIYLSDNTISANIAFGIDAKEINQQAVEEASKIANLHEFILDELPNKYQTIVGERGIKISGGQRQRIGIARALYHNPNVLILDEATSALDNKTEIKVIKNINDLNKEITIIQIAHRLNSIKNCDIIFEIDKGRLINQGTFEEIINIDKST